MCQLIGKKNQHRQHRYTYTYTEKGFKKKKSKSKSPGIPERLLFSFAKTASPVSAHAKTRGASRGWRGVGGLSSGLGLNFGGGDAARRPRRSVGICPSVEGGPGVAAARRPPPPLPTTTKEPETRTVMGGSTSSSQNTSNKQRVSQSSSDALSERTSLGAAYGSKVKRFSQTIYGEKQSFLFFFKFYVYREIRSRYFGLR